MRTIAATHGSRRRGTPLSRGLPALTLLVGGLFLTLAPGAVATSATPAFSAPFTHSLVGHAFSSTSASACTGAAAPMAPQLNLTTGAGRGIDRANGTDCGVAGGGIASLESGFLVRTNLFTVAAAGPHTIRSAWKVSYDASLVVSNVSRGSYAWGNYGIAVYVVVHDATTGSWLFGNTTVLASVFVGYTNGTSTASNTTTAATAWTLSLTPGDSYRVLVYATVSEIIAVGGGYGAHCVAIVDWGSPGHYIRLVDLSIS